MATAETDAGAFPASTGGEGVKENPATDLFTGFSSLNLLRQLLMMVGLAVSIAVGVWSALLVTGEDYRPLYGSLDRLDSGEVVSVLEQAGIKFKVDANTGALLVATGDIHSARLKLAEVGIPGDRSQGFELLDREQPLGTSQFMETARFRRGLEGELARTITSIHSVRSARVHLAIPKRSVFVRDAREPSASVFLELYPGRGVKPAQVRAVANLVASSIPELKLDNVTVVDQKGNLLSTGDESQELLMAARQREYTRKLEDDIILRINSILAPVVGDGRYRAEVSADVDFTAVEQAEEIFNPDLPAVRSEQTLDEQRLGAGQAAGIPGALTNQPGGNGQAPEQIDPANGQPAQNPAGNTRRQSTRNFELDRTVSYTKHQMGKVRRLTVAVVVDDKLDVGAEGEAVRTAWTDDELERLAILVRDAVGFSAIRGDSVNVLNSPFVGRDDEVAFEELPLWQQEWVLRSIKPIGGVLIVLILFLGLFRPVLKSLAASGVKTRAEEEARELAALEASGAGVDGLDSLSDDTVTLTGGDALALPGPEESYEQHLNAVKGLIADDPGRVAQVIKRWINTDE
ncbi:flagellar basal body M-ring protein FliF [Exilibacterium tricleocarpae]|uniref:Flagellar M-ring protein n=1 Tax=Exilibacterium tricleocarpae TaxID=2591008 RepID=A0A545U425_9GAMM|nr:flagellar basal-body MS-ring/collar protein FliF [Exilibacterium tricleocarpae]TQV84163.1 flagellar basal body M-ring protein FliF [Exilibacterium tricleocarpae]